MDVSDEELDALADEVVDRVLEELQEKALDERQLAEWLAGMYDDSVSDVLSQLENLNNDSPEFEERDFASLVGHIYDVKTGEAVEALNRLSDSREHTASSADEFAEHAVHEPAFDGTSTGEWDKPALEDFTDESWEDLSQDGKSAIDDHYILSKSGFPADNFSDLALPVVEPNGDLNLNALRNAKARAGQVEGISDEDVERAKAIIDQLANDNFDDADFADAEAAEVFHAEQERNFEDAEDDAIEVGAHVIHRVDSKKKKQRTE